MSSYCTLQGARRQLDVQNQTQDVLADTDLFFYMLTAAEAIDDYCGRWFDERLLTLGFNGNVGKTPLLSLKDRPLAAVTTLTNGNGSVIDSANYTLLPTSQYPKTLVRLNRGNYWRGPGDISNDCPPFGPLLDKAYAIDAIQIAGLWAYHRRYPYAWRRITQTVAGTGLYADLTDTLLISAHADASFDVGSILRITTNGATEQMLVVGPIANSYPGGFLTDEITVERGYNNTDPIAHSTGDPIDIWQAEPVIVNCTEMAAAAFFKGRDNATGDAQIVAGLDARMVIPTDLPAKIKRMIVPYRSSYWGRPT